MKKLLSILLVSLACCGLLFAVGGKDSSDASKWPQEPVTVICPWAVGGVADMVCDDRYVKWFGTDERETKLFKNALWTFVKKLKQCTAIICCNRVIKDSVMELLATHKKYIPVDYSLAAFDCSKDDCEESNVFASIHPSYEIGREAAKKILLMMRNIPNYKQEDYSVMFSPRFYEGSSVKNFLT